MKILLYSGSAPVGGHLRSAITIAESLINRGHTILFVITQGPAIDILNKKNINYEVLPHFSKKSDDFNWRNYFILRRIINKFQPDILHSFLKGIPQLAIISKSKGIPLVATICGGKPKRFFPKMSPVIVFSEELKKWLIHNKYDSKSVFVIPARMNQHVPSIDSEVESFLPSFGVTKKAKPIIMMICRADSTKRKALESFFNTAEEFAKNNNDGLFVHIGSGNDIEFETSIHKKAKDINSQFNKTILISTSQGSENPVKFLHLADIVVGMGRSAFEGMALGKTTLILSNEGYGGIINQENIEEIANYNFTSRYKQVNNNEEIFLNDIRRLMENEHLMKQSAIFSKKYYDENLDISKSIHKYENIYKSANFNLPSWIDIIKLSFYELTRYFYYAMKS